MLIEISDGQCFKFFKHLVPGEGVTRLKAGSGWMASCWKKVNYLAWFSYAVT